MSLRICPGFAPSSIAASTCSDSKLLAETTLAMNPAFIIECASKIRSIPFVAFISSDVVQVETEIPIRNGGSKNGIVTKTDKVRAILLGSTEIQNPSGTPTTALRPELTTAMNAVVSSSSRLVVKDV